ncbi:T9SS type A sorting domain-containing protein [Chryseobacterium sp. ON_d1]|uniref:T9SS type A sorting domain-containing protein n=1 Tax=Chryseobacterium sp. ON_d1 TaxID=2583211 RepID=UPI001158A350|nr:T9SS type A sorting domain-containing protein [Chryseobacterium sp. ON_d1]GEJ44308.1 hypothetical protein CRS_09160 [Chryseobacterium sp. ON_d1]
MKKYYSIACILSSICFFAQQTVSFESNEGFNIGSINGQAGWISTPTGGIPENVTHQTISSDKASDGSSSLKIVKENTYGTQSDPVIGGFYNLSTPLAYNNFSVSFDINISQLNGSDFGFQGVSSIDDQFVVRLDFNKTGLVKILNIIAGVQNLISTSSVWLPNTWYRFKIVGTASQVRYYLNNILIYTGVAAGSLNIDQLRFVHNNALGLAYIDNIKINSELQILGIKDSETSAKEMTIYPNPASDYLKIHTDIKIDKAEIFDMNGRRTDADINGNQIDIRNLNPGNYMISIETKVGKSTGKFIKK